MIKRFPLSQKICTNNELFDYWIWFSLVRAFLISFCEEDTTVDATAIKGTTKAIQGLSVQDGFFHYLTEFLISQERLACAGDRRKESLWGNLYDVISFLLQKQNIQQNVILKDKKNHNRIVWRCAQMRRGFHFWVDNLCHILHLQSQGKSMLQS